MVFRPGRRCGQAVWAAVMLAIAAASGGLAAPAQRDEEVTELEVVLADYRFEPQALVLRAGRMYRLRLVNRGTVEHEFMVGRGAMASAEGDEHGYRQSLLAAMEAAVRFDSGWVEVMGLHEVGVGPGEEVVVTFTVPETARGEWEMGCFLPGHYELGMHGRFAVR